MRTPRYRRNALKAARTTWAILSGRPTTSEDVEHVRRLAQHVLVHWPAAPELDPAGSVLARVCTDLIQVEQRLKAHEEEHRL